MARKSIQDLSTVGTVKFEKKGQAFEGYYLGFRNVTSDYGTHKLHVFNTPEGNIGAWGSAKLDELMSKVPAGAMTFITYQDKVKLGGGRTMKKYAVEFDDELTIDISSVAGASNNAEAASDDSADDAIEAEASAESDDAGEEEVSAPAVKTRSTRTGGASVSAATISKVDNLLRKG